MDLEQKIHMMRACIKNHIAILTKLNENVSVLDWGNPKSANYSFRYLLDRNYVIVTGNMGEAVYALTEPATLKGISPYDLQYFTRKLKCCSTNVYEFDTYKATQRLKQWKEDGDFDKNCP